MKILLIDLLFQNNGSYNDDFQAISEYLNEHNVVYLQLPVYSVVKNILIIYLKVLFKKYDRVVILSAKVSQLLFLIPISFFSKIYFIYHFIPNNRIYFHKYSLKFMNFFYKIGTYSSGVKSILDEFLKKEIYLLPSRNINKFNSINLLKYKLTNRNISIFVPGIKEGIRNLPNIKNILTNFIFIF